MDLSWLSGSISRPGNLSPAGGAVIHNKLPSDYERGEARLDMIERVTGEPLSEAAKRIARFPWTGEEE